MSTELRGNGYDRCFRAYLRLHSAMLHGNHEAECELIAAMAKPDKDGGLGMAVTSDIAMFTRYGIELPVTRNLANMSIPVTVSETGTIGEQQLGNDAKEFDVRFTKRVKPAWDTLRSTMRVYRATIEEQLSPPKQAYVESVVNREVKAGLTGLEKLGINMTSAQLSVYKDSIAKDVTARLQPSLDWYTYTVYIAMVATAYRFLGDFNKAMVREALPYHDGYFADRVIDKLALSVNDYGYTVFDVVSAYQERVASKQAEQAAQAVITDNVGLSDTVKAEQAAQAVKPVKNSKNSK